MQLLKSLKLIPVFPLVQLHQWLPKKLFRVRVENLPNWGWCDFQTFLLLNNGINPVEAGKTILSIIPEDYQKDYKDAKLVPLNKVYFSKFNLFGNDYLSNRG